MGFRSHYSPGKKYQLLIDTGDCEKLLEALEKATNEGWTVAQTWGSTAGGVNMSYVLLRAPQ
jgi:hypothetical protein